MPLYVQGEDFGFLKTDFRKTKPEQEDQENLVPPEIQPTNILGLSPRL